MLAWRILRGLIVASGAMVCVAGAIAFAGRRSRRGLVDPGRCGCAAQNASSANLEWKPPLDEKSVHIVQQRQDFFSLTRSRSKDSLPRWVLQGFGRHQCFLLFDSWQEAIDQANFRVESLAAGSSDLIQIDRPPRP